MDDTSTIGDVQALRVDLFAHRVRKLARQRNFGAASLGRAVGAKKSSASLYWTGDRPWPVDVLPALAKVLETSSDYLLGIEDVSTSDMVAVHEIDLAYGLGGTYSDGHIDQQSQRFSRAWLESITRTPPSMLMMARGRGDSMQPTLQDDDIVLIDRSITHVREQDAIWALTIGDIAMIKRLRFRGDRVLILSDNERVPVDEAHFEEVNIVGRVIFVGRRL